MLNISVTPRGIRYRERLSIGARLFIAFIGGTCGTMIPIIWISHIDWQAFWFGSAFAVAVSVITALVGAGFVLIALAPVTTLDFDGERRILTRTRNGPLGRSRLEIPFDDIRRFVLSERESEDGKYAVVELFTKGETTPTVLVNLGEQAEAERWRQQLEMLTASRR